MFYLQVQMRALTTSEDNDLGQYQMMVFARDLPHMIPAIYRHLLPRLTQIHFPMH